MNDEKRLGDTHRFRRIYDATHHLDRVAKIPADSHLAVLVDDSLRYDDGYGDDRSGPSYSTRLYLTYITFDTEEALEAWILENHKSKSFKVVSVKPVDVEMKTVIKIRE